MFAKYNYAAVIISVFVAILTVPSTAHMYISRPNSINVKSSVSRRKLPFGNPNKDDTEFAKYDKLNPRIDVVDDDIGETKKVRNDKGIIHPKELAFINRKKAVNSSLENVAINILESSSIVDLESLEK